MRAAQTLRSDLQLGAVYIRVMQESTEDITAPWLLPEMVSRVADMLNYFLDHLAGAVDLPTPLSVMKHSHCCHDAQQDTTQVRG